MEKRLEDVEIEQDEIANTPILKPVNDCILTLRAISDVWKLPVNRIKHLLTEFSEESQKAYVKELRLTKIANDIVDQFELILKMQLNREEAQEKCIKNMVSMLVENWAEDAQEQVGSESLDADFPVEGENDEEANAGRDAIFKVRNLNRPMTYKEPQKPERSDADVQEEKDARRNRNKIKMEVVDDDIPTFGIEDQRDNA